MGRILSGLVAVAIASAPNAAMAADKQSQSLAPSSKWVLNYADDSCKLARTFGTGDGAVILMLTRYAPGNHVWITVAGRPLRSLNPQNFAVQFGPNGRRIDHTSGDGTIGTLRPAFFMGASSLDPRDADKPEARDLAERTAMEIAELNAEPPIALENSLTYLDLGTRRAAKYRLELGSMGAPMAAMRKCTDELMTHWGIDLADHRNLASPAIPLNTEKWLSDDDYPRSAVEKGEQGFIQFRLSVGADGLPTACHIQEASRPKGFEELSCKALMKRARFDPARTTDGKAIASFYRGSIRFQMER